MKLVIEKNDNNNYVHTYIKINLENENEFKAARNSGLKNHEIAYIELERNKLFTSYSDGEVPYYFSFKECDSDELEYYRDNPDWEARGWSNYVKWSGKPRDTRFDYEIPYLIHCYDGPRKREDEIDIFNDRICFLTIENLLHGFEFYTLIDPDYYIDDIFLPAIKKFKEEIDSYIKTINEPWTRKNVTGKRNIDL